MTRVRGNLARIDCLIYGMVKSNLPEWNSRDWADRFLMTQRTRLDTQTNGGQAVRQPGVSVRYESKGSVRVAGQTSATTKWLAATSFCRSTLMDAYRLELAHPFFLYQDEVFHSKGISFSICEMMARLLFYSLFISSFDLMVLLTSLKIPPMG